MRLFLGLILSVFTYVLQAQEFNTLVWSDEFEGEALNESNWTIIEGDGCPNLCGFGNNELQYYTSQNLSLKAGKLVLAAGIDSVGSSGFTSAKLISKNKGDWKYGRVEVRAKLPSGRGTWPAIWMLPTLDRPMKWPLDGEIDIMEHVGYNQGMIYGTIHTDKFNHIKGTQKNDSIYVADAHESFHSYAVQWNEYEMSWEVDGHQYFRLERGKEDYKGWPFDQKFHLILNLAVGGSWGGKYGVDMDIWPQQMVVDYVRIYQ